MRKLRSLVSAEFAVGSIDESGWAYVAPHAAGAGADAAYLEQEKETQLETLRKRRALYTRKRPPIDARDRIAIVVDDGLATGATVIAALHAVMLTTVAPSCLTSVTKSGTTQARQTRLQLRARATE